MSQLKPKHNQRSKSVGERLVERVARATERDPLDLPVLAERIDPESLDQLVSSSPGSLVVRFRYAGRRVTVRGDGRIELGSTPDADGLSER